MPGGLHRLDGVLQGGEVGVAGVEDLALHFATDRADLGLQVRALLALFVGKDVPSSTWSSGVTSTCCPGNIGGQQLAGDRPELHLQFSVGLRGHALLLGPLLGPLGEGLHMVGLQVVLGVLFG